MQRDHLSWALFCEGSSDTPYLEIMLTRLMEDIVARDGSRPIDIPTNSAVRLGMRGRSVDEVAAEACEARDAFRLVFVHADTGGRAVEYRTAQLAGRYCGRMQEICDWPPERCVTLTPRHETEAWILSDPSAILSTLGYRGRPVDVGLPADATEAERLADPKQILARALKQIAGPRRRGRAIEDLYPAIAQRQRLDALRRARSFRAFETSLRAGLVACGCISG